MLKETKVVEAKVNKKRYEEYCSNNGLDPKHKLSNLKYMADVMDNEDAKRFIELYDKGEIGLDAVTLCENGRNPEITDTEFVKGFDMFIKGVAKMLGAESILESSKLDKISKESKMRLVRISADTFSGDLVRMLECVQEGSQMLYLKEKMEQFMKEDEKDDKKA